MNTTKQVADAPNSTPTSFFAKVVDWFRRNVEFGDEVESDVNSGSAYEWRTGSTGAAISARSGMD